jgi:co-chaperonin GroES (HSP10)
MIVVPDQVKERPTDLADVIYVPDLTFSDNEILDNAETIVKTLTRQAKTGSVESLEGLLRLNTFIKEKSIKVGDVLMIGKYVGTNFHDTESTDDLTLLFASEVIGRVVE